MNIKLLCYAISLLCSTFAVSGLNLNNIFKVNRIWEARFFTIILILIIGYLLSNFLYDILTITY